MCLSYFFNLYTSWLVQQIVEDVAEDVVTNTHLLIPLGNSEYSD